MTDPRRLLDDGSEASPALRALLASARRHDDPRASQIEALSARIAAAVAPGVADVPTAPGVADVPTAPGVPSVPRVPGVPSVPRVPRASSVPAPHVIASAAARASHAATYVKAGAVIAALGILCAGAWYVRVIRDDPRTHAETRPAIDLDARQPEPAAAPRAPDPASTEDVAPQPSPAPSLDVADPPPPPATVPKPKRGAGDGDAEAKLVLAAGAALVRDDAQTALTLTRQHLARFPNGAHAEERDRIAIEALARLGRPDDARAAADRFFVQYSESIYRARIEGLLR